MNHKNHSSDNIPTLRFPEFEGNWEVKKLGEVATNRSGKYNPEKENTSIKCIELEHLASETSQLLGCIDGKNSGSIKNRFDKGDVLFGKLRPYLKKYLQAPFDGVCSSEIWVLKGKDISNEFLFRIVQTELFIDLANQSSGSKMPRADWSVVENGLFSFPTLPEQQKIATFLSSVDEKLQALKKKKSLLETYKKGLMQKLFSQQIRFKDDEGNEFEDWEVKTLGEVGDVKMCRRIFNEETSPTGEIPFFKIGSFGKKPDAFISKELYLNYKERFSFPKKGNILISAAGTIGRTVVYNGEDAYFQDSNIVWIDNDNSVIINEFLFYVFQIVKFNTEGGTIQRLYNNILKSTIFYCPSLAEQTKIASFLTAVDEKLNKVDAQIKQTGLWKKGLLQRIFV